MVFYNKNGNQKLCLTVNADSSIDTFTDIINNICETNDYTFNMFSTDSGISVNIPWIDGDIFIK